MSFLRSLFSGVSGIRNHQVMMDVIGNNISNINTVGFKSGRVTCKAPDGRSTARFEPLKAKPGRVRFSVRFQSLTLAEPFAPPLTVRLTTDPGQAVAGIDRVGSFDTCRVTPKSILCVAKP